MKTLDIQLFVLTHVSNLVWRKPFTTAEFINAYVGNRNVTSSVNTCRKRRWIAYRPYWRTTPGPRLQLTLLGYHVLWNSINQALDS